MVWEGHSRLGADSALDSPAETANNNVMHRLSSFFLALSTVACLAAERKVTITVAAGDFDRLNTPVSFAVPADFSEYRFAKAGERLLPLQINGTNASFRPGALMKGAEASYVLVKGDSDVVQEGSIRAERKNQTVEFTHTEIGRRDTTSKPLFAYQAEPGEFPRANIKELFRRGAYLHPIRTLSGKVITDDYPPNHIHHHGIWWAWTKTEFDGRAPDFWNMGEGKAKVDFVALQGTWGGPVHGGFVSKHQFTDLTGGSPAAALNEAWDLRVYNNARDNIWAFDLTSTQECATDKPLKLPEYYYGGLGFRGHWDWNGKTNVNFLTSEGITDREKGNT